MLLKLSDIFQFTDEELRHVRLRFHVWENSIDYTRFYYLSDKEQVNSWNIFYNPEKKRYLSVDDLILNFIKIGKDRWLLTTVKRVTMDLEVSGRYFDRCAHEVEVAELLAEPFAGLDFPGYDNICLSYNQLATVLRLEQRDWLTALSNQKAIYLLTDKHTGKLYVGSATSDSGMLLQRWQTYIHSGHGGNKELRTVVQEKGFDYIKEYFQYSLLENYNAKVDDHYILQRESWWKKVLKSREFGYNAN